MVNPKLPHLIYRHGVWHVVKNEPLYDLGCSLGKAWIVESEGKTPDEALANYYGVVTISRPVSERRMQTDAQKALLDGCGNLSIDAIYEESHREVMRELARIGKKALPVILALAAGVAIGVAYG